MDQFDFMHLVEFPKFSQIPMAVCIGVFDGVHRGHQEILRTCVRQAKAMACQSMAITFDRNPKRNGGKQKRDLSLLSKRQFCELMENIGIEHLVVIDFSTDFSKISADTFLGLVCMICTVRALVVGEDFRCGTPASCAGPVQLQEYLNRHVPEGKVIIPPFVRGKDGRVISSTLVRKGVREGDLGVVRDMLGRPYGLDLTRYPSKIHCRSLIYRVGCFEQLLPPAGTYCSVLSFSDGAETSVSARLTECTLTVEGKEQWIPKARRAKILALLERRGT